MSFEFSHPHFAEIYQGGAAIEDAEIVVIGFHGRGGNADAIFNKVGEAVGGSNDVAYLSPLAENNLWFRDEFVAADNPQLLKSLEAVGALIHALNDAGISSDRIVLAGQSQGAVLVDEYLAATGIDVRAVVSWSGALVGPFYEEVMSGQINPFSSNPLAGLEYDRIPPEYRDADLTGQTITLAVHEDDPKVPLEMVLATADYYRSQGAVVEMHVEPGESHQITDYDVAKLRDVLNYDRDNATFHTEDTADGGFVTSVVETHRNDSSDSRIVVKVCNAMGYSVSGSEFVIESTQGEIKSMDMAVLDDGNFAFVYVGADNVMKADIYTADGELVSDQILASGVDAASLNVDAVDGGFEVDYASVYGSDSHTVCDCKGEPMDVVLAGTSASETLIGTDGDDEMYGYGGRDALQGLAGNDVMRGGGGKDNLFGGDGDDKLIGQGGDDVLDGGAGDNKLVGGKGADTFIIDGADGINRIVDFESGVDTIIIRSDGVDDFGDIDVRHLNSGADLLTFDDTQLYVTGAYTDADILFG